MSALGASYAAECQCNFAQLWEIVRVRTADWRRYVSMAHG